MRACGAMLQCRRSSKQQASIYNCFKKGGVGILDNFFTTVHIDYICKIQYIAQIGNPFHTFCNTVYSAAELWPTVCRTAPPSPQTAFRPSRLAIRREGFQHAVVGLHSVTQHFRLSLQVLVSFCTLYKYVI